MSVGNKNFLIFIHCFKGPSFLVQLEFNKESKSFYFLIIILKCTCTNEDGALNKSNKYAGKPIALKIQQTIEII